MAVARSSTFQSDINIAPAPACLKARCKPNTPSTGKILPRAVSHAERTTSLVFDLSAAFSSVSKQNPWVAMWSISGECFVTQIVVLQGVV